MLTNLGPRSPRQRTAAAPVPGPSWNRTLSFERRPQITRQATSAPSPLNTIHSSVTRPRLDQLGDTTFSPLSEVSSASVVFAVAVTQTTRLVSTKHALIPASSASASASSVLPPGLPTSQPPTHQSTRVASSLSFGGNSTTRGPALLSASPPPTFDLPGQPASLSSDSLVAGATSIETTALTSNIASNNPVAIFSATGTSTRFPPTARTRAWHSRLDTQQHVASRSLHSSLTAATETVRGSIGTSIVSSAIMAATTTDSPNAVDILLSALPTSMASSLVSDFNSLTSELAISIAGASTLTTSASATISSPTSILGASTLHQITSSATTSNAHSIPGASTRPATTSHSISSITSSLQTASPTPSALSTSSNSLADKQTPSMSPKQLKNASVAGIATGAAAGVVLILLLTIFLLRRRARGQTPFRPRRSHPPSSSRGSKRVFPEGLALANVINLCYCLLILMMVEMLKDRAEVRRGRDVSRCESLKTSMACARKEEREKERR
nr:hypothetical protein CFP56_04002 [Quercus suber]